MSISAFNCRKKLLRQSLGICTIHIYQNQLQLATATCVYCVIHQEPKKEI